VVENCKHHGGKTGEKQLFQFLAWSDNPRSVRIGQQPKRVLRISK
jgi:hypothetical protein